MDRKIVEIRGGACSYPLFCRKIHIRRKLAWTDESLLDGQGVGIMIVET